MRRFRPALLLLLALLLSLAGCSSALLRQAAGVTEPPADYEGESEGFRYARSTLTSREKYLYDQLLSGMKEQAEEIKDLYPDNDAIEKAAGAVYRDYPELFWLSGSGSLENLMLEDLAVEAVYTPTYLMDTQQRQEIQGKIDQWTADCLASIDQSASQYDQALGVYVYLIEHADYQQVENNSIANIMVNGGGLCGCYAKTYQYLLNLLGIDAAYITGQAGGASHAWNLVWLDGIPCWVDPTWGDPVFTGGEEDFGPDYTYFGLTTADLQRTHTIDAAVPVPVCTSNDANYYERNGLYFETYDADSLVSLFRRTILSGGSQCSLRYSDQGYAAACAALFTQGRLAYLFADAGGDANLVNAGAIRYTRSDSMGVLTFAWGG